MPDKNATNAPGPSPQRLTPSGQLLPTEVTPTEPEETLLETQSKPMGCWMGIGLLLLLAVAFWLITILGR